jgi:hypothetical protein
MSYASNVPNWRQRLTTELRADKRKAALLGALLVVGGVVCGRMIIQKMVPSEAGAAPGAAAVSAGPGDSRPLGRLDRASGGDAVRPDKFIQQLGRTVKRDLFTPNTDFFPPEKRSVIVPRVPVVVETRPVEDEQEAEKQVIQAQARAMSLQSTMMSQPPSAVVNGRVLRVGDWINGFQVAQIAPRTCVIEKRGLRFTLEMKRDE